MMDQLTSSPSIIKSDKNYKQGNLVLLSPGDYINASNIQGNQAYTSLTGETQAILVELQGKHFKTNESCWSVLANNDLLIVWENHLRA